MENSNVLRDPNPAIEAARQAEIDRIHANGSLTVRASQPSVEPVATPVPAQVMYGVGGESPIAAGPDSIWNAWKGID